MAVAATLKHHLDQAGIEPEVLTHPYTPSALRTAEASHVSGDRVAKAVLLRDDAGFHLLAVLPASHHIDLEALARLTGRSLALATEDDVGRAFPDCVVGAVPAVGAAYGLPVMVDDSLASQPDVYLEAGDHESLLRVSGEQFARLMPGARHGVFSRRG